MAQRLASAAAAAARSAQEKKASSSRSGPATGPGGVAIVGGGMNLP